MRVSVASMYIIYVYIVACVRFVVSIPRRVRPRVRTPPDGQIILIIRHTLSFLVPVLFLFCFRPGSRIPVRGGRGQGAGDGGGPRPGCHAGRIQRGEALSLACRSISFMGATSGDADFASK